MLNQSFTRPPQQRLAQRGQVVVGLLAILVIGFGSALYAFVSPTGSAIERDKITAAALAQAKEALIGWSVGRGSGTGTNRPGELPCPDTDNDGFAEGSCAAGRIGRVPWRTLGIPEPKDEAGETLWYAISGRFRIWGSNSNPINSDTRGNIVVRSGTSAVTQTSEAIAVIFAPGASLGTQQRDSASAWCSTTSTTIPHNRCAANYLETASGVNNATTGGPFISAQEIPGSFNDRVLAVTTVDLMTLVEKRAVREILTMLQAYRSASGCNCYPWADFSDGESATGDNYGRVPLLGALPHSWGSLGISVPQWLRENEWWWVFFYTIAPSETQWHSAGTLTIDGVSGKSVVLITPGPAGATRPVGSPGTWDNDWWSFYVDDPNNSDMGSNFITPSSTAYARDRIYTIP